MFVQWLGVVLLVAALAAALGVMLARSLFALCMHVLATGATIAVFVALVNAADVGLMIAAAVIAVSILMICGVTLTARTVKAAQTHGASLARILGAAAVAALLIAMAAPQFALSAPAPPTGGALHVTVWLAPLMLTLAAACLGLLGFGERGALEPDRRDP